MPVCRNCGAETPEDEYRLYSGQCRACYVLYGNILRKKRFSKRTKVWLIISLIIGVIGAIIGFIYWFHGLCCPRDLDSWIGAGFGALIGFGIGFLIPTIFMILANLAKTNYFILVLLLITGIIGAVIGGFIGARIGEVAAGILIGFLIGFIGPLLLAICGMGGGCD